MLIPSSLKPIMQDRSCFIRRKLSLIHIPINRQSNYRFQNRLSRSFCWNFQKYLFHNSKLLNDNAFSDVGVVVCTRNSNLEIIRLPKRYLNPEMNTKTFAEKVWFWIRGRVCDKESSKIHLRRIINVELFIKGTAVKLKRHN